MVNKRGLSPEEYFSLDPEVLNMLMIYDTFIEPSGTQMTCSPLISTPRC